MLSPSQQKTLEELDRWQGVIDTPEKWCKGTVARDYKGIGTTITSTYATSWSLIGAKIRAGVSSEAERLVRKLLKASPTAFNDDPSTTHADVMALFERAKEKVRNS